MDTWASIGPFMYFPIKGTTGSPILKDTGKQTALLDGSVARDWRWGVIVPKLSLENANLFLSVERDFHQVYAQMHILYKTFYGIDRHVNWLTSDNLT